MKKFLAILLALVMVLSLVACGAETEEPPWSRRRRGRACGRACGRTRGRAAGETGTGSVYYLNFKPEADAAWQALAESYTAQTGRGG